MAKKKLVAADDYRGGGDLVMAQAGGVGGVVIICHCVTALDMLY